MADEGFKFQVSLKAGNHMLNVRADSADELRTLLYDLYDEEAASFIIDDFKPADKSAEGFDAVANVQAAFPDAPVPVAQPQQDDGGMTGSYDPCGKFDPNTGRQCVELKTKWVPPGTSSKTGKPYKGFFACPINHRG